MTPQEIPAELVAILDDAAGRRHSAEGSVLETLAKILTRHRQLVLAAAAMNGVGVYPVPSGPGFRVGAIHAFLAVDDDGDEGVPAFQLGDQMMPLIAADHERVEQLRPLAHHLAASQGITMRLVRFTRREDVELIAP